MSCHPISNRMPIIRFAPAAEEEIHAIASYIRDGNPFAAEQWVIELEQKCRNIAEHPRIGHRRDDVLDGLYCFPFGKYLIFYDIASDGIEVVHVIHGARDIGVILSES